MWRALRSSCEPPRPTSCWRSTRGAPRDRSLGSLRSTFSGWYRRTLRRGYSQSRCWRADRSGCVDRSSSRGSCSTSSGATTRRTQVATASGDGLAVGMGNAERHVRSGHGSDVDAADSIVTSRVVVRVPLRGPLQWRLCSLSLEPHVKDVSQFHFRNGGFTSVTRRDRRVLLAEGCRRPRLVVVGNGAGSVGSQLVSCSSTPATRRRRPRMCLELAVAIRRTSEKAPSDASGGGSCGGPGHRAGPRRP